MKRFKFTITEKSTKEDKAIVLSSVKYSSIDNAKARMHEVYSSYYDDINVKRAECADSHCEIYFDDGSILTLKISKIAI